MLSTKLILENIGQSVVDTLKNDIKNKSLVSGFPPPNTTGELYESIRFEATEDSLKVYAKPYIYYLVHGRGPTRKSEGNKLLPIIRKWIDDKGILPRNKADGKPLNKDANKAKDSLAYMITRKIHAEGTLIYKQGGSDLLSAIITDSFIANVKEQLIFNTVDAIKSEIMKAA